MSTFLNRWSSRRPIPAPKRGPQARLATPLAAGRNGLRFTEILILGVLALATLFALSKPIFGITLHLSSISHFPLLLLGPLLVLHLTGRLLNRDARDLASTVSATWPLVALALFALGGSALARWEFGIDDTYLSLGVYLLLLPFYFASTPNEFERSRSWAVVLMAVSLAFSLAALGGEVLRGGVAALHEIEYIVIGGFLLMFYWVRSTAMKCLALALLIAAAVLNQKLTGYIIALLAVSHITVLAGWQRLKHEWRGAYAVTAVVGVLLFAATAVLLYFEFRSVLPSGNPEVRLRQYEAAWYQFLKSPIWGHAYLEGSGEEYVENFRVMNIPTHSDVLDILKHGGLIGLSLFIWGYAKIFLVLNKAVALARGDGVLHPYFVWMRFFHITALITFSINPLLVRGPYLVVLWANLGMACGLAYTLMAHHKRSSA